MSPRRLIALPRRLRTRSSERGIVAVWVALLSVVLFGIGAFAVDVARWYVEGERLQKASDNASMSGVVYLPGDAQEARATARTIAESNGWTIDGDDVTFLADPEPDRPTRLRVTMSSEVDNSLARILGVDSTRITRTAVADYGAPSAVGNPCNVFGNQDMEDPVDQVAGSNCLANAEYWLNIAGDNTNKARGDGYGSGWCTRPDGGQSGIDNCHSVSQNPPGINADHSTATGQKTFEGYVFNIRPKQSGTLSLSAYDLGWVLTGDHCDDSRSKVVGAEVGNDFVDASEASDRYETASKSAPSPFCPGDTLMNPPEGDGTSTVETKITVREPSPNPWEPLRGDPICTYTLPGWGADTPQSALDGGSADYDRQLAQTFHRWSGLCGEGNATSLSVEAGQDYVVQVQTSGPGGTRGGGGQNRFALRAEMSPGGGDAVNIYAVSKFSIFVNTLARNTEFNLIRLDSSTAGKVLEVGLFDIGDAAAPVTAQVLRPDGNPFTSCDFVGPGQAKNPDTCSVTATPSTNGGRWLTVRAPIPSDYRCADDEDLTQCWVSMKLNSTASQQDTTTWTAQVLGDPVRLVE